MTADAKPTPNKPPTAPTVAPASAPMLDSPKEGLIKAASKLQIPKPKSQTNPQTQIPNPAANTFRLALGTWDLFGVWGLGFGV